MNRKRVWQHGAIDDHEVVLVHTIACCMKGEGAMNPRRHPDASRYEVMWPLARKRIAPRADVASLTDLSGKTVAQVWDRMFRGEEIFAEMREHLSARFPGIKFIPHERFGDIHGPDERAVVAKLVPRLREFGCDAAIVGIGA